MVKLFAKKWWYFKSFTVRKQYDFPGGTNGQEPAYQCRRHRDMDLIPGMEDTLGECMETCSSVLALRIPWTEEPGGLQPIESHGVGHDWRDSALAQHKPHTPGILLLGIYLTKVSPKFRFINSVIMTLPAWHYPNSHQW